ncbi:hypothetical protein EC912_101698 [Luteibacter rhizovicinus]|uniref:Probable membrane transporter protein n=1 Tax=Luteibacter rhizovicinus TaxID=242606 RepID=A0A4R3YY49_9GAMM|nr:sulfite exporter TauE/SafE family protein [Luteibacter rhizovicinus]TCV97681.1 hypothetical protein EC912_101698 [Luteibacter rhizovicinus]
MPPLSEFLTFVAAGVLAQLVDGALGMAFGVVSAGILLALGLPPALASASVHYAETFTCGASGLSHYLAGNVRKRLLWTLAVPGLIGATIGAYVVTHVPATWMKLALTPYLLGVGVFLIARGVRAARVTNDDPRSPKWLGFLAGLADTIGGGGWSAINVTALIARGATPRIVVGTVHVAKCIVSAAASVSFLFHVGAPHLASVGGLIVGGMLAAPFGAAFARRVPARAMTWLAALAVLGLGLNNVARAFV